MIALEALCGVAQRLGRHGRGTGAPKSARAEDPEAGGLPNRPPAGYPPL